MNETELWSKCVAFHGHECGGLTIGFKAALYAMKLLELKHSEDEEDGRSVRLVLRPKPEGMTREQTFAYYQKTAPEELFDVKKPRLDLPEEAHIFDSYVCEVCGESAASNWIRIQNGKKVCVDCYKTYDRFHV